ncbi:MAG: nicotinate-nucleotide--dimethylbenzimidazole phosphoribosyltransferase [Actinobacteria bacterium]|nr:nicotinate-nucleotide--dimethylbenzimidazole phosphoribosyltransferase [Actinomycetota bacterium]
MHNFNIEGIVKEIVELDGDSMSRAQARLDSLTKPQGSLGRLEELAKQISGITHSLNPDMSKKLIIVMAADHGVVNEGVSAYPKEVTPQMVYNFLNGGAGINVLSNHVGADVVVVDTGVAADLTALSSNSSFINKKIASGTENMAKGPAMSAEQARQAIGIGIDVARQMIEKEYGIIGTGDMGIGNTTASSAIASCMCGVDAEFVTGYGTGINQEGFIKKVNVIRKVIEVNKPDCRDGFDVLAKIGGFEIGGIAGVILGCAARHVPVVIDGFISGAGALIAESIAPKCREYMIASHSSVEKGHKIMLEKLGLKPLFNFDMRLGEGTGAALGINIAEASMKILNKMATFGEAGVSQKKWVIQKKF